MTLTEQFNESIAKNGFDFYSSYTVRYIEADERCRKESKDHWLKCHAANIADDRNDLYIFTSKILAAITLAVKALEEQHYYNIQYIGTKEKYITVTDDYAVWNWNSR